MLKTIAHALIPGEDAISLLKDDHRKVESLFKQFESSDNKRDKLKIAREICMELAVHDKLESKIFYPATKSTAKPAKDEINEGIVEHEAIRRLIREIPSMKATDEFFETRVGVLIEYVKHHVKEEEHSMFPKIVESKTDLKALGEQMTAAKERYQSEYVAPATRAANSTGAETGSGKSSSGKSAGTKSTGAAKSKNTKAAARASAA